MSWFDRLTKSPEALAPLLVRYCDGFWTFPGAGVEYHNREQALRECIKALRKEVADE